MGSEAGDDAAPDFAPTTSSSRTTSSWERTPASAGGTTTATRAPPTPTSASRSSPTSSGARRSPRSCSTRSRPAAPRPGHAHQQHPLRKRGGDGAADRQPRRMDNHRQSVPRRGAVRRQRRVEHRRRPAAGRARRRRGRRVVPARRSRHPPATRAGPSARCPRTSHARPAAPATRPSARTNRHTCGMIGPVGWRAVIVLTASALALAAGCEEQPSIVRGFGSQQLLHVRDASFSFFCPAAGPRVLRHRARRARRRRGPL